MLSSRASMQKNLVFRSEVFSIMSAVLSQKSGWFLSWVKRALALGNCKAKNNHFRDNEKLKWAQTTVSGFPEYIVLTTASKRVTFSLVQGMEWSIIFSAWARFIRSKEAQIVYFCL
jgi:hypothetical protein